MSLRRCGDLDEKCDHSPILSSTVQEKKAIRSHHCSLCDIHGIRKSKRGHKQKCQFEDEKHWKKCYECFFKMYEREIVAVKEYVRRNLKQDPDFSVEEKLMKIIDDSNVISKVWKKKCFTENFDFTDEEIERYRQDEPGLRTIVNKLSDRECDDILTEEICQLLCAFPTEDEKTIVSKLSSFAASDVSIKFFKHKKFPHKTEVNPVLNND